MITCKDKKYGIEVDISLNAKNAVLAARVFKNILDHPLHGPEVRALFPLFKQFLVSRGLNKTFTGGLNAMASLVTVVNFTKTRTKMSGRFRPDDTFVEFKDLLKFVRDFNISESCMTIDGMKLKVDTFKNAGLAEVCIQDPCEPSNNLSVKVRSYMWDKIVCGIKTVESKLETAEGKDGVKYKGSMLGVIFSVDGAKSDQRALWKKKFEKKE